MKSTKLKITEVKYKSGFQPINDAPKVAARNIAAKAVNISDNRKLEFHEAVRSGATSAVQHLLSLGCIDPDEPDWAGSGRAPLLEAVLRRDIDTVRILLASGCSVDACTSQGESALYLAANNTPLCPQMVALLLDSGADPDIQERLSGNTPLHVLVTKHMKPAMLSPSSSEVPGTENKNRKKFENTLHIYESGDIESSISPAGSDVEYDRKEVLEGLSRLARQGDVSARNFNGCTALHRAVAASTDDALVSERVRVLLDAGEGRGACSQNEFGETPLHLAADRRLPLTAEALLESASELDVNARDRYRMTALHYAANKRCPAIVTLLLRQPGCDVNAADLNGDTPLHLAAGKGHAEVVRILLDGDSGVDPNSINDKGQLPLHKAIESSFVDVVEVLLEANCEVLVHTCYELTPLDLACTEGVYRARPEISRLLLRAVQDTVDDCTISETPI